MFKKSFVPLCFLGLASSAFASDVNTPNNDVKIVEQIIAKVNNEIITMGDLERQRQEAQAELERQKLPPERFKAAFDDFQKNLLRDQIDRALLVQKAKDLDINVDNDLSKYLAQIQLESKIVDPDQFQQWVRQQVGTSFEDFKQKTKDSMLQQEVIRREVGSRIVISTAEARKYYDEHKNDFVRDESVYLQEIFLSTDGKTPEQVAAIEKKAKDLVSRARKGENFGNLARDNSDAETARNYGELPSPSKRGDLRKDMEDVVFKEAKGYVTDPFRLPNGFEILRVSEHYQQGLQPFEAVQEEIMGKLYNERMQPAVREYLTKLRQQAFLQIRAGYVDSGAAPGKDTTWKDPLKLVPQTVTKEEVAAQPRRKRLLGIIPIPGTNAAAKNKTAAGK
jgi:parvulin-like peptidyl-prolyl isomerase